MTTRERAPRLLGEFESADAMLTALTRLREAGYRTLETYAPFDIPETTAMLGIGRTWIPAICFLGGLGGAIGAYLIQWYADTWSYPLNVGGRPVNPIPAYIPATFEGTVLIAALATFFGLFLLLRLPALWHPVFEIDGFERATIDRFWVEVGGVESAFDSEHAREVLAAAGALRVVPLGAAP